MNERSFSTLSEVIDALTAARTLGLKNVSVSSSFRPSSCDPEFVRSSWTYRVQLDEEPASSSRPLPGTDEYALLFANTAAPVHLHLPGDGCAECTDAEPMSA